MNTTKKLKLTLGSTIVILIMLTLISIVFSNVEINRQTFIITILFLSSAKFLLVGFKFLELHRSHFFWKWFIVLFIFSYVGVMLLVL